MCNMWTEEEIKLLKKDYPTNGKNIPKLLENHKSQDIRNKARALNVSYEKKPKIWSNEDIELLKEKYPIYGTDFPNCWRNMELIVLEIKLRSLRFHAMQKGLRYGIITKSKY